MNTKIMTIAMIIIILAIAGCVNKDETIKQSDEDKKIGQDVKETVQQKVDESNLRSKDLFSLKRNSAIDNDMIDFGVDKGFFEEDGIRIQDIGVLAPGTELAALTKGDIDFSVTHFGVVRQIARGVQVKVVLSRGMFTPEGPHHRWLVLNNSNIRTAKDLIGKKIAVMSRNGCTDYGILEYMSRNGIDKPEEKAELMIIPISNMEQALRSGRVDVIGPIAGSWLSNNFYAKKMLAEGGIRELSGVEFEAIRSDYEVNGTPGWYFTTKFINDHPEAVKGFVRGMLKTHQYINKNFDEYANWMARKNNISVDWIEPPTMIGDGLVTDEGVESDTLPAVKQFGLRKDEYQNMKWSDIYTNEFNPYYKK